MERPTRAKCGVHATVGATGITGKGHPTPRPVWSQGKLPRRGEVYAESIKMEGMIELRREKVMM